MKRLTLLFLVVCLGCATEKENPLTPHEGYVPVEGGKIWYKVMNEGPGIPLLALHGGPGSRSCSGVEGWQLLNGQRPVIIFDQLESGFSDRPNDTTLWEIGYFVKQVKAIKDALELEEFHLLGSSWGGSVAVEYMVTADVSEVQSVIFSGPLISTPRWMEDAQELVSRLSQPVRDTIYKYEALEIYDNPQYLAATDSFYANFLSRKQWPPRGTPEACDGAGSFNFNIYSYMWGPTEFTSTGTLQTFDRTPDLPTIKKPTLFIAGEYDEVLPETLEYFQSQVEGAKMAITPGAGHAQLGDNPEFYIRTINEFMNDVESNLP